MSRPVRNVTTCAEPRPNTQSRSKVKLRSAIQRMVHTQPLVFFKEKIPLSLATFGGGKRWREASNYCGNCTNPFVCERHLLPHKLAPRGNGFGRLRILWYKLSETIPH